MGKILLLIFILLSFNIFSQEESEKIITYDEYMKLVEEKLLEFKQLKNNLEISKNNVKTARSLYDVDFAASMSGIRRKDYLDGQPGSIDYSAGFIADTSFSTTLPSGTVVTIGGEYSQMYTHGISESYGFDISSGLTTVEDNYLNTTYDPVIKIKVAQPLLFNYFGFLSRFPLNDAKMKLEIDKLKYDENHKMTLVIYQKLYFNWIELRQKIRFLEKAIENSKRLEAQTVQKMKSGIAENDELQMVKYSVYKYEEQYGNLLMLYNNTINDLSVFFDAETYQPEENAFEAFFNTAFNSTIDDIQYEETRGAKIIALSKKNLEYNKKILFNQTLPQLNLFANLDIKFHQYLNEPEDGDDDFDMSNGDVDLVAGLEFKYKIGSHNERGQLNDLKLKINDLNLVNDINKRDYDRRYNQISNWLARYKEIIDIKKKNINSLESRYRTERKKYNQARLELRNLIDTDNTITTEEMEFIDVQAKIINLYFDYQKLVEK